jgi:hypothetical protein
MISTGNNAADAVQLIFGLMKLAQNYEVSAKWNYLMPETMERSQAGEQRAHVCSRFSSPKWGAGNLRALSSPVKAGSGVALAATIPH